MKTNKFFLFLFCGSLTLLFACGGGDSTEVVYNYEKADSLSVDYLRELGNIRVSIEQTGKLNAMLKEEGYSYNSSMLNSASKATGYSNSKQQAFNLGAYGADLNYAISYEQSQDAMGYVKAMIQLADKLGVPNAFDEKLLTQMTSDDSTINKSILLTKAYIKAEDQLYSEDRAQLATMMVVGGWVEGLYISTSAAKTKPGSGNINSGIWNQAYTYSNIIKMLKIFENSSTDCAELLKGLEEIREPVNRLVQSEGNLKPDRIAEANDAIAKLRSKHI